MALQVYYNSAPRASMVHNAVSQGIIIPTNRHHTVVRVLVDRNYYARVNARRRERRLRTVVTASLDSKTAAVGKVTEVDKDTFWPIVEAAGDKTVVLDMYTQWCGPCKVIAPKYQELSEKYDDVLFLKLDCNQDNKPLAKELGIKVVPTFKILKDSKIVKEVTGAKFDDLVAAIETARSST